MVTPYSGKVELGTSVYTAQIAAEELSVPLASVKVIQGDTPLTPDHNATAMLPSANALSSSAYFQPGVLFG